MAQTGVFQKHSKENKLTDKQNTECSNFPVGNLKFFNKFQQKFLKQFL